MTLSDKLTRDQVRDAFNRNLTYADLCGIDIRALQGFMRWLKEWMNCTRGIPRSAIADPAAYAAALAC